MYEIVFYEDKDGNSPVRDYTNALAIGNDKNSRAKFKSIAYQLQRLETMVLGLESVMPNTLTAKFGNCVLFVTEFYLRRGLIIHLYYFTTL